MSLSSSFWENNVYDGLTSLMVGQSVMIANAIVIGAMVFTIGKNALSNSIGGLSGQEEGKVFDMQYVGKLLAIFLMINVYQSVAPVVTDTLTSSNKSFHPSDVVYNKFGTTNLEGEIKNKNMLKIKGAILEYFLDDKLTDADSKKLASLENKYKNTAEAKAAIDITKGEQLGMASAMQGLSFWEMMDPLIMISFIMHAITSMLAGMIKIIATNVAFWFFKIMLIIGPLAIGLTAFNPDGKNYQKWLGGLVNVGLIGLMFNLLDMFFSSFQLAGANGGGSTWSTLYATMTFDISMIVMYISAFKITQYIYGSNAGGGMVGKAIMVSGAAAAAVVVAAGGGAALAKGGGGAAAGGGAGGAGGSGGAKNMLGNISSGIQKGSRNMKED